MASACIHKNKPHYSNGLCQNCYLAQYYLKRKKKNDYFVFIFYLTKYVGKLFRIEKILDKSIFIVRFIIN